MFQNPVVVARPDFTQRRRRRRAHNREMDGNETERDMVPARWYRRNWDGPNGEEPDRGPGTLYLEASLDGTCLRQVGIYDNGLKRNDDWRELDENHEFLRPDPVRHESLADYRITRQDFEHAWARGRVRPMP